MIIHSERYLPAERVVLQVLLHYVQVGYRVRVFKRNICTNFDN